MALELYPGEELVTVTRPHVRTLFGPVLGLFVISALTGVGIAILGARFDELGEQIVIGAGALATVFVVLRPIVRWAATSVTLTTQRLIIRTGIVRRDDRQVPLNRVVEVTISRSAGDLGFGSGTLLLTTMGGQQLRLAHLPRIKAMCAAVSELSNEAQPQPWGGYDSWADPEPWGPDAGQDEYWH
ncbi:PH domain-containing protein [Propionimicrobium sp. PCR01-08-3]|uniref:PH domain-containing protein n=1 Tax=Propionimicrobium sp. PCR01-08-3 TaxID=3052086 RepID=UPI00255C9174|nr:PH domain-containing protein [Propionimicrobium sp. PCR01-08-3]WIY83309.1 PH domain-containing protein [Propionimicrobium sp. PCR01-08-3]